MTETANHLTGMTWADVGRHSSWPAGELVPVLQVGVHPSGRAHWDDGVDPAHRVVPVLSSVSSRGGEPRRVGLPDDRGDLGGHGGEG